MWKRRCGNYTCLCVILLVASTAAADQFCLAPEWKCVDAPSAAVAVSPADADRPFVWRGEQTLLGIVPAKATEARRPSLTTTLSFRVAGSPRRGWPEPATITMADERAAWTWTHAATDAAEQIKLPAGAYKLTITADHHRILTYPRVAIGAKPVDLGRLMLEPSLRLTGRVVTGKKREALRNVAVSSVDGRQLTVTDTAGVFAVETNEPLRQIVVSRSGFGDRIVPITHGGASIDMGDVFLHKGVTFICGIERPGRAEVEVSLLQEWGMPPALRPARMLRLTKEQRLFRAEGLEPARYMLVVKGPSPLQQFATKVDVDDLGTVEKQIFIEPAHVRVHVEHGHDPLPGARVSFMIYARMNEVIETPGMVTDEEGNIDAELWQSGQLNARVISDAVATHVVDSRDINSDEVEWTISIPRQRIVGTVTDAETGKPVAGAVIRHEGETRGTNGFSPVRKTDGNGGFVLDATADGTHTITVDAAGYRRPDPITIEVHGEEERHIEIRLKRGNTVQLTIFDGSGAPAASAPAIEGFTEEGNPRTFHSADESGQLLIGGAPGETHRLFVFPKNGSFAIVDVKTAADAPSEVPVHVPRGSGAMRIEAVTTDGQPVANLRFLLRYNGEFFPSGAQGVMTFQQGRRDYTDLTGIALFDTLPEGTYEIWPFATEMEAARIQSRPTPPLATVRVTSGETEVRLVIEPKSG